MNKSEKSATSDSIYTNIKTATAFEHELDQNDVVIISLEPNQYQINSEQKTTIVSSVKVGLDGFVSIPFVGKVKVDGLTISQLNDTIYSIYSKVYINPSVNVQLGSFNISVLGDVRMPGFKQVSSSNINIFEAVGLASDLSDDANRRNVKILRKNKEGKTDIFELDLTSINTLSSEAYYLKSNDIVIVSQNNYKRYASKSTQLYGLFAAVNIILTLSFKFIK